MTKQTKEEAHAKFIEWIESHPGDLWTIIGGDSVELKTYSALAVKADGFNFQYDSVIFKYEQEND